MLFKEKDFRVSFRCLCKRGDCGPWISGVGSPHVCHDAIRVRGIDIFPVELLVAVPSGVKVFNWIATLYKGSISFETPMLYVLAFIGLFVVGGLTGLFLAALAADVHLSDTYFVIAHFHYIMVGGMVTAFMGGLHFWWPKITGRIYSEKLGQLAH
jgi:cytochrome c oxidase subunit 1